MTTAQRKLLLGIYSCMCDGMTNKEIAKEMNVSLSPVVRYKKILKNL